MKQYLHTKQINEISWSALLSLMKNVDMQNAVVWRGFVEYFVRCARIW